MEDRATIIPVYSPLDGVVDGQWTYSPNDGGPDAIPGLGQIDDAMVIMWVFNALKDEFLKWRIWRGKQEIQGAIAEALEEARKDGSR